MNNNQQNTAPVQSAEKSIVEKLGDKVSDVLSKYNEMKESNAKLTEELAAANAKIEANLKEINDLTEQNEMKDLEMEEIANRIESIFGK
jgi:predicted  nucleic acid-binding Zn-ribbon protein